MFCMTLPRIPEDSRVALYAGLYTFVGISSF